MAQAAPRGAPTTRTADTPATATAKAQEDQAGAATTTPCRQAAPVPAATTTGATAGAADTGAALLSRNELAPLHPSMEVRPSRKG